MKKLLLILTILNLSCHAPLNWFITAGQSNMVGASNQVTIPVLEGGFVYRSTDGQYTEIKDPYITWPFGVDLGNSLVPAFAAYHTGREGIITTARSSSCLNDWGPGRPARWLPPNGDLYLTMIDSWKEVNSPPVKAVLWLQGECDAQGPWDLDLGYQVAYDAYYDGLTALADAVYSEIGTIIVVTPIVNTGPKTWPVVDAIHDVVNDHPHVVLGAMTDDLEMMPDETHIFDVNELGRRIAVIVNGL